MDRPGRINDETYSGQCGTLLAVTMIMDNKGDKNEFFNNKIMYQWKENTCTTWFLIRLSTNI